MFLSVHLVMTDYICPTAGRGGGWDHQEQHSTEAQHLGPEAEAEDQRQRGAEGAAEGQQIYTEHFCFLAETANRGLMKTELHPEAELSSCCLTHTGRKSIYNNILCR